MPIMTRKFLFAVLSIIILLVITGFVFVNTRPTYVFAENVDYQYLVKDVSPDSGHYITEKVIHSSKTDAKYALINSGFVVYDEDIIKVTPDIKLRIGGEIEITRAPLINIVDGKKARAVHSWAKTVADLFTEKSVPEIGKDDKVDKSLSDPIVHNMTIIIVRVQETDIYDTQVISYTTITKDDPTQYRGQPDIVKQQGKNGQKVLTYHVRREDGIEVSRKLIKTDITNAIDKIVLRPTKLKIGRVQNGNATWYKSKYQAASNALRRGTNVRVSSPITGKSIEIQIQDYMENDGSDGRNVIIDLHPDYFRQLGYSIGQGVVSVKVEEILN